MLSLVEKDRSYQDMLGTDKAHEVVRLRDSDGFLHGHRVSAVDFECSAALSIGQLALRSDVVA